MVTISVYTMGPPPPKHLHFQYVITFGVPNCKYDQTPHHDKYGAIPGTPPPRSAIKALRASILGCYFFNVWVSIYVQSSHDIPVGLVLGFK